MNFKLIFDYLLKNWPKVAAFIAEAIWPIVKEKVIEAVSVFADWLFKKFKEIFDEQNETLKDTAESKAEEAELKANQSTDVQQIELFKREAQIWREVSDLLIKSEVVTKEQMEKLKTEANIRIQNQKNINQKDIEKAITNRVPELPDVPELSDNAR